MLEPVDSEGNRVEDEESFTLETLSYRGVAIVTDGRKEFKFEGGL